MNSTKLATKINKKFQLKDERFAQKIIKEIIIEMGDSLYRGEKVTLKGFATFYIDIKKGFFSGIVGRVVKPVWIPKVRFHKSLRNRIKSKPVYIDETEN